MEPLWPFLWLGKGVYEETERVISSTEKIHGREANDLQAHTGRLWKNVASSCVPFSQKTGLAGGQDEALSGSAGWEISVLGAMGQTKTSTRGTVTWLCLQADGPSQTQSGGQTLSWGLIMLYPCGLTSTGKG